MKRIKIFSLAVILFLSLIVSAQDLNWGFEDWEMDNEIETPTGWSVNHFVNNTDSLWVNRFYKDSIHVIEGNYSLRAEKDDQVTSAFMDCTSRADLFLELNDPLGSGMSVYFSAKAEGRNELGETFLGVTVGFSDGLDYLGRVEWLIYEEIEEFVEIELPIEFDEAKVISISIEGASQNGALDGCNLNSQVWIDALRIAQSTTVDVLDLSTEEIQFFPNPTIGMITLSTYEMHNNYFSVTNTTGKIIQEGIVVNDQIILKNGGLNFLTIYNDDGSRVRLKCIKID